MPLTNCVNVTYIRCVPVCVESVALHTWGQSANHQQVEVYQSKCVFVPFQLLTQSSYQNMLLLICGNFCFFPFHWIFINTSVTMLNLLNHLICQCQHIQNLLSCGFVAGLLHWITLHCTGESNKLVNQTVLVLNEKQPNCAHSALMCTTNKQSKHRFVLNPC